MAARASGCNIYIGVLREIYRGSVREKQIDFQNRSN
jgi:hypothetical protein